MTSEKRLEDLIDGLSGDLNPVRPLAHPLWRAGVCFVLTAAYLAATVYGLHPRMDWMDKFHELNFLFEMSLAGAVWISALLCAGWLCVPDMRGQEWMKAVPVTLTGIFVLWSVLRGVMDGVSIFPLHWDHCFENGFLMGMVPLALVAFFSRGGTTTHPYWLALMNTLAVGSAGWMGLRLTCSMDDVGHGFLYHFVPFLVLGSLIGVFARRLFRW
ncbi:MAG: DUF1109 family protein [Rhodospirillales bacterium]|nr:DUF1109 family protein [Alphaproteobacteria bacterium]USO03369.1 MAG: DUF1109 family protein [Rhodospirillales bacterium]